MYGDALDSQFWNGYVAGIPDGVDIYWKLGTPKTEHCPDCLDIAAGSPYTKETLPTTPGAGHTRCLTRCYCSLDFPLTRVEGPEAERRALDSILPPSCLVTFEDGSLASETMRVAFERLYDEINRMRQVIEIASEMEKAGWIASHRSLVREVIDLQRQLGVRAVPTYSVKELTQVVRGLSDLGFEPIMNTRMIDTGVSVYVVKNTRIMSGFLAEILTSEDFAFLHRGQVVRANVKNYVVMGRRLPTTPTGPAGTFYNSYRGGADSIKLTEAEFAKSWVERCRRSRAVGWVKGKEAFEDIASFNIKSPTWKDRAGPIFDAIFEDEGRRFDIWVRNHLYGREGGWSTSCSSPGATALKGLTEKIFGVRTAYHFDTKSVEALKGQLLSETIEYRSALDLMRSRLANSLLADVGLRRELGFPHPEVVGGIVPAKSQAAALARYREMLTDDVLERLFASSIGRLKKTGDIVLQLASKAKEGVKLTTDGMVQVWRGTTPGEVKKLTEFVEANFSKAVFNKTTGKYELLIDRWSVELNSLSSVSHSDKYWSKFGTNMLSFKVDPRDVMYGEQLGRLLAEDELIVLDRRHRLVEALLIVRDPIRGGHAQVLVKVAGA